MDSYLYREFQWTACHECELRDDSILCEAGKNVTIARSNYFKHGCWSGALVEELKDEIHNQSDR